MVNAARVGYGGLHLSPNVNVVPNVLLDQEATFQSDFKTAFSFQDRQARFALARDGFKSW